MMTAMPNSSGLRLMMTEFASKARCRIGTKRRIGRWKTSASDRTVDFLVVGAGSAGCVMASRLAEAGCSVMLLEAGSQRSLYGPASIMTRMPSALSWPMHFSEFNWKFEAKESSALVGRRISCPRGRGLGGSSSINGMVYVRGHALDYEAWELAGANGWGWTGVAGYFKKMENYNGPDDGTDLRGRDGPLHVKVGSNVLGTPLFDAFVRAGESSGYGSLSGDYNGLRQEGLGVMPATIFHSGPRQGERCSTAAAYLEPAIRAGLALEIVTGAAVARLMWDEKRVVGVTCADGREFKAGTTVLCAGAIGSPHILQVSGVGDPALLARIGATPKVALPGVGANLQDHLEFYMQFACADYSTLAPVLRSRPHQLWLGARWLLARTGLGATNHFEAGGFVRSRPGIEYPNVQLHFLPVAVSYDGVTMVSTPSGHSFQLHVGCNRSPSRGTVTARSLNIREAPEIDFRYMSADTDWVDFRTAIRIVRHIVANMDLGGIYEVTPGLEAASTDSDIDAFLAKKLESAYHPCGTCRMGADDDDNAVCSPHGAVRDTFGLHVCDASLFPSIINGNLNAPTIMLAEKLSDHVLGNQPPPPPLTALQHPRGWISPEWRTKSTSNLCGKSQRPKL